MADALKTTDIRKIIGQPRHGLLYLGMDANRTAAAALPVTGEDDFEQ